LSDIEDMVKNKEIEDTRESRLDVLKKFKHKRPGNPDTHTISFFTDDEFEVWAEDIREYSRRGFPFTERKVRVMMQNAVRKHYELAGEEFDDRPKSLGGQIPDFGTCFMKRSAVSSFLW
jgi:hypothetical protein